MNEIMYKPKSVPAKIREVFVYVFLLIWAFINVFPLYWMFTFSLKSNEEILGESANPIGLPRVWQWENYKKALNVGHIGVAYMNSIIVAVITILVVLLVAMMATFALTRFVWKFKKKMNDFFMLGLTIPIHVAILPIYLTLSRLHMLNSLVGLIIPYAAFSLSMGILVCTGFMQDIPKELDESACIDGCNAWGIFFRVIVPLMKPAVATVAIYTFLQCWNEFMLANTYISDSLHKTIPIAVQALRGQYLVEWGIIGAAMVIATFPMLIAYAFFSKQIQGSFIAGAIKG